MHSILEHCGPSPLRILGTLNHRNAWDLDSPQLFAFTIASSGTVNIQRDVKGQTGVQIISYQRPDPSRMQFMSLRPISLSIQEKAERIGLEIPPFEGIDAAERAEEKKLEQLVEKLKLHTVKTYEPTQKDEALPQLISQVNCSYDINAVLQQNVGLVRPRARRRALSVGERVVESANDLWDYTLMALWYIWTVWLFPIATKCLILAIMAHRIFGEAVMSTAHRPVGPRKTALTDISATAQQVDLRLQQFCYWPIQYLTLKERKKQWECISTNHSEYIRFYNSLWLVANDVIMGIAIGTYIIENADSVASHADKVLGLWSLEGLRRSISWLMVYPGGLKLNNELARFLGDLFLWVIDYWGGELIPVLNAVSRADMHRMRCNASTPFATHFSLHRFCLLRRGHHATKSHVRPVVSMHPSHLLLLHCIRAYLRLAAHHHHIPLPSLPRKEAQCSSESDRLLRLRAGPAFARYHPVHAALLPPAHRYGLLHDLCACQDGHYLSQSDPRHPIGLSKPLSPVRAHVTSQRPIPITR